MIDNRVPQQEDELFDLLREVAEAIDAGAVFTVRELIRRHSQEAGEIRSFIDDYIAYREEERRLADGQPPVQGSIEIAASRLLELPRSLAGEARRQQRTVQGLAQALKLPLDVFSKLDTRAIRLDTVPVKLIRQLAAELSLSFWQVAAYLRQPRMQPAYYADRPPETAVQQTFDEVLESSRAMARDAVADWLAEERLADVLAGDE